MERCEMENYFSGSPKTAVNSDSRGCLQWIDGCGFMRFYAEYWAPAMYIFSRRAPLKCSIRVLFTNAVLSKPNMRTTSRTIAEPVIR